MNWQRGRIRSSFLEEFGEQVGIRSIIFGLLNQGIEDLKELRPSVIGFSHQKKKARTHLLVGLLDLVICGRLADAEDGVVVLAHRGAAVGGVGASGRAGKVDRARCAFVFELLLWVRATLGVKS